MKTQKIQPNSFSRAKYVVAVMVLATATISLAVPQLAHAANTPFTNSFVRYDTLKQATATTGRVCFQPQIATTMATLAVTFPTNAATDYAVSTTVANWTPSTTGITTTDPNETAVPAAQITGATVAVSGKTVTWTWGTSWTTPSTSSLYCFNWTNSAALTLPNNSTESVPGSVTSYTTGGSTVVNSSNFSYSQALLSNNQVTVNAVVPPSFQFVLSSNTDTYASNLPLNTATATPGYTITVTTNAAHGYVVWVKDTNFKTTGVTDAGSSPANEHGALASANAGYQISNLTSNSLGTASHLVSSEDYGLNTTLSAAGSGLGTTTINANYIGTTAAYAGVLDATQFRPIASGNGTANTATLALKEITYITANTPAGNDYTDTLNYIGAGQF